MEDVLNQNDVEFCRSLGIDIIDESRNYWFIRTQGGAYFDDFYFDGFVGIEWDEISDVNYIKKSTIDELKIDIFNKYPDINNLGYVAGQIKRFVEDIKKGDIVLIPNANSERIAFGEVLEDDVYIYDESQFEAYMNDSDCDSKLIIKKRRKVRWIKSVKRKDIDPYLYKIIYSHTAIVDANPYEVFIDRTLSPLYIKNGKAYLRYKVNQKKDVSGIDISGFVYNSINLLDYVEDEEINKKNISTKINVQSEGIVQFIGPMFAIFTMAMGVNMITGGEASFLGLTVKTEGLSKTILNWIETIHKLKLENKEFNQRLNESITNLEIVPPKINLPNEEAVGEVAEEIENK